MSKDAKVADDTLFDIDILNDSAEPSNSTQPHIIANNRDAEARVIPPHTFPEETIDLDNDDNIENDIYDNPFQDEESTTWDTNRFETNNYQPQLYPTGQRNGFFANSFNKVKNIFVFNTKPSDSGSYEMNRYNAVTCLLYTSRCV